MSFYDALKLELEDTVEALLREDYEEELEDIEDLDDLIEELLCDFDTDIGNIVENYFRNSIPSLTKEKVDEFVSNYEPEEEDDEDVE
tara:strand:+ start:1398 stop:1658 length:261 start_codon:yes stop_codon:yes gene_type:complete